MSRNEDPAIPPGPGSSLPSCPPLNRQLQLQDDRFRFTPVKNSHPAPRVWDRKPSTAYMARSRSRKVWKRFRTSFNSMKQLQQLILAEQDGIEDELSTEINTSRNAGLLRGVKRQCCARGEIPSAKCLDAESSRSRSFLETKWESQTMGRRRKLPAKYRSLVAGSEPMEMEDRDNSCDLTDGETTADTTTSDVEVVQDDNVEESESRCLTPDTPTELAPEPAYPDTLHGQAAGMTATAANIKPAGIDTSPFNFDFFAAGPAGTVDSNTAEDRLMLGETMSDDRRCDLADAEKQVPQPVSAPVAEQKSVVPVTTTEAPMQELTAEQESTLVRSALRSSLDGEDAELLNNFLSKAKAKREAKAAAALIAQDGEDEKEANQEEEPEVAEMPTPQTRRALEDLDANSPSPQKPQLSPSKSSAKEQPSAEDASPTSPQKTASPRRSTRTRNARLPSRGTAAGNAVRSTFSLRRAKGTEFVFLQRTEAQELALATRRNTRQNKGDALLPKYALQALAQGPKLDDDKHDRRRAKPAKKSVSWNEERLAQFEGEDDSPDGGEAGASDVVGRRGRSKSTKGAAADKRKAASSSRSTRSQGSPNSGGESEGVESAATTAPATATPRARRVRRLGASASATTAAAAAPGDNDSSSGSSSPEKRKKLTPKSPTAGLSGSSTPKKTGSSIPKASVLGSSSGRSASLNLLKANAGSTPMPRRVRSRS